MSSPKLKTPYYDDIQTIFSRHSIHFVYIPKGLPQNKGFYHIIELYYGPKHIMITPYRHPHMYKYEVKNTIKEILDMGFIHPSSITFTSYVVLVKKKDGSLRMYMYYKVLDKNIGTLSLEWMNS